MAYDVVLDNQHPIFFYNMVASGYYVRKVVLAWLREHVGQPGVDWELWEDEHDTSKLCLKFNQHGHALMFKLTWA